MTHPSEIEKFALEQKEKALLDFTNKWFKEHIQETQYVGRVYSISYESALVQIHDYHRRQVGGIPSLSFLIATRIKTGERGD